MADLKISQLTAISVLTPATDVLPVVDVGGVTKKITTNQILASGGVASLASATITGAATVGTTLGVTGVSTLASAVVTGDLTVNTNVLKVDSTNDCVGILTATPDADRLANTGLVIGNGTSARGIMFYGTSSSQQNLAFSDTAAAQQGLLQYDHSVDQMKFFTSGALQATLTTTALTIANGNVVMATSGKGIDFSAVTGGTGTATANVLNDYEEGTWTGTLSGATSAPTTPVTATGKYTKIGRQVSIQISFLAVDTTGASSRILVTGLPFATSSSPSGITGSVLIDAMATFTGSPSVYLTPSSTQIDLYASVSNGAIASVTHNAGAAKSLWLNVTYTV